MHGRCCAGLPSRRLDCGFGLFGFLYNRKARDTVAERIILPWFDSKVAACTYKSVAIHQACLGLRRGYKLQKIVTALGRIHHPLELLQKCGVVAVQLSESRALNLSGFLMK